MSPTSLRIPLPDLQDETWYPMYIQDRARYASATSVKLINDRTLVGCSLLGMRMYLVHFDLDTGHHDVVDHIETTFGGVATQTDLCDVDEHGHVITSNCKSASMTLYQITQDKIRHRRDLPTHRSNYCHGARFAGPGVVAAAMLNEPWGVYFYDAITLQEQLYVDTERRPKDICFLSPSQAAIATTSSEPLNQQAHRRHVSAVIAIEFDLAQGRHRKITQQKFPGGQFDSIAAHAGKLYVADSYADQILVLDDQTLQQVDTVKDNLTFPHGVDANYGLLAVACYGDNAIHVRRLMR